MAIHLDSGTVESLKKRAKILGVEVEPMTNELIQRVLADEEAALEAFDNFIQPRVEQAKRGEFSPRQISQILQDIEHQ